LSRTNSTYQASPQNFFPFSYEETIGESAPDDFLYVKENHLGSVLTTVSDQKIPVDNNSDNIVDFYLADVTSATDYYSFGSSMPGRKFISSNSYRYGFNGKEKDDEISGTGNSYDFGARIYDPRTGRWLSTDAAEKHFPELSPYSSFANNPIYIIDQDGDYIIIHYTNIWGKDKTLQYVPNERHILRGSFVRQTERALNYLHKQDVKGVISKFAYDSKHNVDISMFDDPTQKFGSSRSSTKVTYDPTEGQQVKNEINTGLQSPALRLYHEIAQQLIRQFDKNFKKYGREELEQKVIDEYENFIAAPLGEPQRQTHSATEVQPNTVQNSTEHNLRTQKDEDEFQKQVDKDIDSGMFEENKSKGSSGGGKSSKGGEKNKSRASF